MTRHFTVPKIFARIALVATLMLALLPTASPAVALATTVVSSDTIEVTGYSIQKGGIANYTGAIKKGDKVTIALSVRDSRTFLDAYSAGNPPTPSARLNTASFTIGSQADIAVSNLAPATTGSGWTYTLTFKDLSYTGVDQTFRASILYGALDDAPLYTYELNVYQCVVYVAPEPTPTPEPMPPTVVTKGTGFVLIASDFGKEPLYAGKEFSLRLTWAATKGSSSVDDVTVGINPPQGMSLSEGSSLTYIGSVSAGESIPVSYKLLVNADVTEGGFALSVDINGIDSVSGSPIQAQATITVPVLQPERFEIFSTSLPTDLFIGMADGSGYGSVTLVNKGRVPVANVSLEIQGAGLSTEEGKQYLGHIQGGEQKTVDFNLMASEPGQIKATLVITWENTRGETRELTQEFTVNVMEGSFEPDPGLIVGPELVEETPVGLPWWVWALMVLVILAALILALVLLRRRAKKKAAALAALDDDWPDDDADEGGFSGGGAETSNWKPLA